MWARYFNVTNIELYNKQAKCKLLLYTFCGCKDKHFFHPTNPKATFFIKTTRSAFKKMVGVVIIMQICFIRHGRIEFVLTLFLISIGQSCVFICLFLNL